MDIDQSVDDAFFRWILCLACGSHVSKPESLVGKLHILCYCAGSVFKSGWLDCPAEWSQPQLVAEFEAIRAVKAITNKALDLARSKKLIRSSRDAEVAIVTDSKLLEQLLDYHIQAPSAREGSVECSLRNILFVSRISLSAMEGHQGSKESGEVTYEGETSTVEVMVCPASWSGHCKCPRCWKYTSTEEGSVCDRCGTVEEQMGGYGD